MIANLPHWVNSSPPRQNGRHFADDIFNHIFMNENIRISIQISPKFVLTAPIDNKSALVQVMAWRRPGDKPLGAKELSALWVKRSMSKRSVALLVFFFLLNCRDTMFSADLQQLNGAGADANSE